MWIINTEYIFWHIYQHLLQLGMNPSSFYMVTLFDCICVQSKWPIWSHFFFFEVIFNLRYLSEPHTSSLNKKWTKADVCGFIFVYYLNIPTPSKNYL